MKDFITAMKLIPFGLKFRRQIIFGSVFFVLGVVFLFASSRMEEGSSTIGGFYIAFSSMFLVQMVISTTLSNIVQTSPLKKKLQTLYPTLICAVFSLVSYTIFILLLNLRMFIFPEEDMRSIIESLLCVNAMLLATELYMGVVYKYFIPSVLCVLVAIYALIFGTRFPNNPVSLLAGRISFPMAIIIGYVLLILGVFAEYGISCAFYKKDIDKLAFSSAMKKPN